jgi:hypothetical protein
LGTIITKLRDNNSPNLGTKIPQKEGQKKPKKMDKNCKTVPKEIAQKPW